MSVQELGPIWGSRMLVFIAARTQQAHFRAEINPNLVLQFDSRDSLFGCWVVPYD